MVNDVKKSHQIHPAIRKALGYDPRISDRDMLTDWKGRLQTVCKPCWELKYCPYGPLVENFPLLPLTKRETVERDEYLKKCLETRKLGNGRRLDKVQPTYLNDK